MTTQRNLQGGFYLVEALVVCIILAIGLLALSQLHAAMLDYSSLIKQRNEASQIIKGELESFRNFQCIIPITGCTSAYQNIVSGTRTVSGSNTIYTLTWTVINNSNPSYKIVDMTASWAAQVGSTESIRLNTIITPNDPTLSASLLSATPSGN